MLNNPCCQCSILTKGVSVYLDLQNKPGHYVFQQILNRKYPMSANYVPMYTMLSGMMYRYYIIQSTETESGKSRSFDLQ